MEQGTILLVDDNPQLLAVMAGLLRPLGYSVVSALSGQAALNLAAAHPPDLVLLDVMMPDMDGFAVTRAIREHPLLAQLPIILVTALDDRDSRVRGFEAGADDFITKPFDYVELRARIATILRLNRYRRLLDEQARVAAERARFVWAVEQSADGVLIVGPDDRPRYANPRARLLLGLPAAGSLDAPFLALVTRSYSLTPAEAWAGWPDDPSPPLPRFLVRPESHSVAEAWLRVELLPPSAGDDTRVISLRDVTAEIRTQREMWAFHAVISHKLRTPLMSIIGGLSLLANPPGSSDAESLARIARIALDGARRLRESIEDVLRYVRPPGDPSGGEALSVAEAAQLARTLAAQQGIRAALVVYEPALGARLLAITRSGLDLVLREVLENAVKFHPRRQPAVTIRLDAAAGDALAISIADDGPGLTADLLTLAWRPYYQGERSFTGQIEGMGLGLPLVARIVHGVGGRYAIANRDDAQGTVVTLTLPLASAQLQALSRQPEPPPEPSPGPGDPAA
jgi:two-component system, cell cycle response regulator